MNQRPLRTVRRPRFAGLESLAGRGAAALAAVLLTAPMATSLAPVAPGVPAATADVGPRTAAVDIDPTVHDVLARHGRVTVVVRAAEGHLATVVAAARSAGVEVLAELPLVAGFAAHVDVDGLSVLAGRADVIAVTADHEAVFLGESGSGPAGDSWFEQTIGADVLRARGLDGSGVGIAVLDSGVAAHPTLGDRVRTGIDLTAEANGVDGHGHGTFLAGLAAGSGASSPGGSYDGIAPGAHVVPVKIGSADGVSLVSLLAGLQWIHHNRNHHDIDVVNMSFGTRSPQSSSVDPLNFAVQRLWADGLVVVVAAGNLGADGPSTITKPADDPFVITVGSVDSMGTVTPADDTVPSFSSRGPTLADGIAKPDLVAPGRSLVGPVAPGSAVAAMTDAHVADGWVRATGTSMSAAVVSGAVALLLEANPGWTPGQVKGALQQSASPGPVGDPNVDGHGIVDVAAAADVVSPADPNRGIAFGTGLGPLEDTLGDVASELRRSTLALPQTVAIEVPVRRCVLFACVDVRVEVEVAASSLEFFDPATYLTDFEVASWAQTQFHGQEWHGNQWYGNQWYGNQWYGNQWYGNQWYGDDWS